MHETHLDAVKNARVEHVDTGIDTVTHELDWLLNESINDCTSGFGHNHTVCRWLGDLGDLDTLGDS
jgi:hypothetical protein